MVNKKIVCSLLTGAVICSSAVVGYKQIFASTAKKNVTVLSYSSSKNVKASTGYKITSISSGEGLAWLSSNEILTTSSKGITKNPNAPNIDYKVGYFQVYNMDTGKIKEYKDVNIGAFYGVSPDKTYALYEEPKDIPIVESNEWKSQLNSGEIFSRSVKLLNLKTGEITSLKTELRAKEANYSWINNNTLFIYYPNEGGKWVIEDVSGKIYKSGIFKVSGFSMPAWPAYNLNIKLSGDSVSGQFIAKQDDDCVANVTDKSTYYTVDINTNKMTQIYRSKGSSNFEVENNTLLIDDYTCKYDGCATPSTKLLAFDNNGTKKSEYSFSNIVSADAAEISKDGSKAVAENTVPDFNNHAEPSVSTNIIDMKTGKMTPISEFGNGNSFKWNDDGTALIFNKNGIEYLYREQ